MKRLLIVFLLVFGVANSFADSIEERVLVAGNIMKKLIISKNGIPMEIIKEAQAIVVMPDSVKFGFFIGGKYGEGLATVRKQDGSWSYPFFIKLSGGSLGLQIGLEKTNSILVFRTKDSVGELLSGKLKVGANASASVGYISANSDKIDETNMSAEIFAYSQSSGLFAGAVLDGVIISNDDKKNKTLYGKSIDVKDIIIAENLSDTYSVQEFFRIVNYLTKK
ncbi:MAG: lipid-binding SYLF domain-containing protein [Sulfurospirillum sp.]|nr:lipid-binding SYLF domain-containing protein [Sulfurospirillum sp.]MBL0702531.1 lipid-binding SYLF domain-containing protein [Sulfurospirillum sp.]